MLVCSFLIWEVDDEPSLSHRSDKLTRLDVPELQKSWTYMKKNCIKGHTVTNYKDMALLSMLQLSKYWLSRQSVFQSIKCDPVTGPVVAQRVGRGIALLFHARGTSRGWVVSSMPQPYFTTVKDLIPIVQEARWAPGPVWTGGKSRPTRNRSSNWPACSQSLYRLSYPGHVSKCCSLKFPFL